MMAAPAAHGPTASTPSSSLGSSTDTTPLLQRHSADTTSSSTLMDGGGLAQEGQLRGGGARSPSPAASSSAASSTSYAALSASHLLHEQLAARRKRALRRSRHGGGKNGAKNAAFTRAVSLVAALVAALCAGSVTAFSLYAPLFQARLRYTQLQVNGVAMGAGIALYLPVPALGYLCDRVGAAPLSLLAGALFGIGYGAAACVYRDASASQNQRKHHTLGGGHAVDESSDWTYPLMVGAFVCIGVATCAMYLAAVATCAKNFGRGRFRGLALALPIAAFGLSGMWLSQLGSRVFYEPRPDGSKGDIDVYRFFVFLAVLLAVVGLLGTFTLRVVDEQDLIDDAVDELERSGFLDGDAVFSPTVAAPAASTGGAGKAAQGVDANNSSLPPTSAEATAASSSAHVRISDRTGGYGTMSSAVTTAGGKQQHPALSDGVDDDDNRISEAEDDEDTAVATRLLDPSKDLDGPAEEVDPSMAAAEAGKWRKALLLNAETRAFLADHTMWFLTMGFFLMVGPGEAYINNLGSIIGTLYPPPPGDAINSTMLTAIPGTTMIGGTTPLPPSSMTSAATHVSIIGISSTAARLLTGTLTDLLAPTPQAHHVQLSTLNKAPRGILPTIFYYGRVSVSRVVFLLGAGLVLSFGLAFLAAGLAQGPEHDAAATLWLSSACVGAGYGAVFSLTPIVVTVIWGVENFATNWGIVAMFPALGSSLWGLVYSAVYQAGVKASGPDGDGIFCYGERCYSPAFWAMAISTWIACLFVVWAWRGRDGWVHRGIVI